MILLDLFSGIGGFSKGFLDAGWQIDTHYFSDIDKYANTVYKYHFKEAINVGDVRFISGIERPNIITFGSPCQDFSLAGKRKGLDGERSSLIGSAIALVERYKPDLFIWENVKGVFSSNDGADFWAVVKAFADIGSYRLEWQLLNTAWFLPQNRERIYLIGHLGGESGRQVFPIGEENGGNNEIGERELGKDVSYMIDANYYKGISPNGFQSARRQLVNYDAIPNGIKKNQSIRRLTPIETERLQGFPDNWTKCGDFDGEIKEISDSQRYKMCGNAVTVKVVETIAKRLKGDL